ncbi:MAG: 6-phosphofructokinase [Candidatus Omnitrophica bacterium]|nr:6-phosphofructokinase [Candidatus Omnitrophota bacterium]
MKRIGVMTTGGDVSGLNACIRAVVRTAIYHGLQVTGICRGYRGMMEGDMIPLDNRSVGGIINKGGTILLSARSQEFRTEEGQKKAAKQLEASGIEGLVLIGGNGSLKGGDDLAKWTKIPIIGVPKSIDNDIGGTEYAIGFDTAVNVVVDVIDKIRDTATSHERLFLVEVMGRDRGFLALESALAAGAEDVLLPETATDVKDICNQLDKGKKSGKTSSIIVVAEGDEIGGAFELAKQIENVSPYEVRISIVGHMQRGGAPSAKDRVLGSSFGQTAVEALLAGESHKLVAYVDGRLILKPLEVAWDQCRPLNENMLRLSHILSH